MAPTSSTLQLVRGEVQSVDLRLCKIVPACHVALRLDLWESLQDIDYVLFPGPGHHGAQMRTNFVCGATWILSLLYSCVLVDPIQKLADFFASKLFKWNTTAPPLPNIS